MKKTTKKYKLITGSVRYGDKKLYQIEALKDFSDVKKGDLGGYVQSEKNLSQKANCWIYNKAKVLDNAYVSGNSKVSGGSLVGGFVGISDNAIVCGMAHISDNVQVYNNGKVGGSSVVFGNVHVYDNGQVFGQAYVGDNVKVCGTNKVSGGFLVEDTSTKGGTNVLRMVVLMAILASATLIWLIA